MKNSIGKMWNIFDANQKARLIGLLVMIVIGAFLELLGVSAIMPFINVAMSPASIQDNAGLSYFYTLLGAKSSSQFLIWIALALVAVYIIKNIYMIILYNFQYKFTYESQRKLEGELLSSYLKEDYSFHLLNNSAELQRNIIQDVMGLFHSVLAVLQLLTEGVVCLTLFAFLLYKDKTITIGVVVFMSAFLLLFVGIFRKKIEGIGVESRRASAKRVQWVQQSLGGIKEIKILEREQYFLKNYDINSAVYADKQRLYQLTTVIPRPIMEALCICSLLLIVIFKLGRGVDPAYFLVTLSVFAVAAFRLLPSFSRISGYLGTIVFQSSAVDRVDEDIRHIKERRNNQTEKTVHGDTEKINFDRIEIRNISFRYENTETDVLKQVSFAIERNSSVAFIGTSGAGKSTLADIILGILKPWQGSVYAGDTDIFENLEEWHHMIGYIPQTIYLMDDTIRKNIAFGMEEEEIDEERFREVLKEAQLSEFVQTLEMGAETIIGESGVRLSGGQRQRIGIARALYHNPQILVLDEATAALDNETEKAIMESIESLQGSKTLIIIAHRLTTIQNCDYVYEIGNQTAVLKKKKEN